MAPSKSSSTNSTNEASAQPHTPGRPRRNSSSASLEDAIVSNYVKALTHDVRVEIVRAVKESSSDGCSPSALHAKWASSSKRNLPRVLRSSGPPALGTVSYHFRMLLNYGVITLSHTAPRRGALEHYYVLAPDFAKYLRKTREMLESL